ncbi:hypothetical protein BKH42_03275 [Helicobacter sp. 13S00482-2]|uniref:hypothetical protein n=1 Tax=Helicobacter sp. 13S00482-2 TaxID=1476200 RepID=UPI000BA56356|nr:hypothetical protein [Helicobacter sp. 13S00482-2]PAF54000.1 hypothetical protein BKH42_03275 [Helicobacter sp. 13S00482-2]
MLLQFQLFGCGFFTNCFEWEYKPPKIVDFYFDRTLPLFSDISGYQTTSEFNAGGILHFGRKNFAKSTANSILIYLSAGYDVLPIVFRPNNPFGYKTGELVKTGAYGYGIDAQYPLISLNLESRLLLSDSHKIKILGFIKALFGYSYGNYTRTEHIILGRGYYMWWYDRTYHPEVQVGFIFENISDNDVRLGIKFNSVDILSLDFIHRY